MPHALPVVEFAFPGPLRDQIVEAIQSGMKTATSSLVYECEVCDEALPAVGDRGTVIDPSDAPLSEIETVGVQIVPLRDVPLTHAIAEGEGYDSVVEWRAGHLRFWGSPEMRAELGENFVIDDTTLIVLESFKVAR
ncbi:ASCH domain-containing protein [Homoserinimonas sp. OAct 916]|uniref:ASCH domain-containing protein n=1 Tax=Homoserinimonas sp. OAct 916 TaxID=2211450 RepID=UPI000DBE8D89|nr:ASCH domain-containing protein [Homoserinimonas sp. OAct 916]